MLPPTNIRQGALVLARNQALLTTALKASTSTLLRVGLTNHSRRSFWGWRRPHDWTSHLDPLYHRYHRVRTLKTRAKLLDKLRRRGKFEWDSNAAAFFTPKYIRWASRWDGTGDGRFKKGLWSSGSEVEDADKKSSGREGEGVEGEGYELSQREKIWKQQMEVMRKRIENDPYEAIFGKRFEPFWSPLVPSWMREEMGLPVWKMSKEAVPGQADKSTSTSGPVKDAESIEPKDGPEKLVEAVKKMHADVKDTIKAAESKVEQTEPKKPSTYAYASSTSWDSWTNRTKRVEWDSVSGQTKKYEYDPISNRMIQVEAPKPAELKKPDTAKEPTNSTAEPTSESKAVNIPVKQSADVRKSIPIPPPLSQPFYSAPIGFSPKPTSVGPVKSTAVASDVPKSAALAKLPEKGVAAEEKKEQNLDSLTAESIRASIPKLGPILVSKHTHAQKITLSPPPATNPQQQGEQDPVSLFNSLDAAPQIDAVNAMLKERDLAKHRLYTSKHATEWDRAETDVLLQRELESLHKKKEKLLKDERGLFHIERQKRELMKLEGRIQEVGDRMERLNKALSMDSAAKDKVDASTGRDKVLQPSLERMQSKSQVSKQSAVAADKQVEDADDAAAHESTEPIQPSAPVGGSGVPKNWDKAADLLQADRVKRTASKASYPDMHTLINSAAHEQLRSRHINLSNLTPRREFNPSKDENQFPEPAQQATGQEQAVSDARAAKLEKANKLLEAEVAEQKIRMQAHETRYAHKMRSLRDELEIAYRQSAVHGEKHVEHIKDLEKALEKLRKESGAASMEKKYAEKMKALRAELETAYKQSTVHSEKHVERIRTLEQELAKVHKAVGDSNATATLKNAELSQAEGDLTAGVAKFAGSEKWYKRPTITPASIKREMEKAEQKRKDRELVKEVRAIYEKAYGVIDTNHRQAAPVEEEKVKKLAEKRARNVVEVESDVDLGEALAKYEKDQKVDYNNDSFAKDLGLENAVAAREREAHEGVKLVDDAVPKLIPTQLGQVGDMAVLSDTATAASLDVSRIQWAQPPLYKVLAYDSGNDMMSTTTTTSNFAGAEEAISVPEAMSQLYAPAKFVTSFAELQGEGWQVVYGSREVLVFRKVENALAKTAEEIGGKVDIRVGLEDHGLYSSSAEGTEKASQKTLEDARKDFSEVNPIDGTATSTQHAQQQHRSAPPDDAKEAQTAEMENEELDYDIRHYPRVKREEYPVFTGTRRKWNNAHRERRHAKLVERIKERKARRRATWKRVLGTGLLAAVVAYAVGAVAEKERDEAARKKAAAERAIRREGGFTRHGSSVGGGKWV